MADLPNPESYDQINSEMLSAYATKLGLDDFNVGSAITSFFEVVALAVARSSGDVFQILKDFSVDRATGDALKRLATENNVTPITAKPATGPVSVIDTSFTKVATKIYAGANPPNVGSAAIKVSSATSFPSTGSVYIGRGTPNIEGPLAYTSITPSGGFFIINLSAPTTKFHNLGESVILAQGGIRTIPANTIVIAPAVGASPDIEFSVTSAAVILDGETQVDNVPVSAQTPGESSNVPIGSITKFASDPFTGATVQNALPFSTGSDNETDDQLRVRIKRALASTGLGTATAVQAAVIGATPSDEQATVVSDNLIIDASGNATLYVDNGNVYEEKSNGVGLESIIDSALGGEQFFQLATGGRQAPIAKAYLQSNLAAPFDIIGGDTLALTVGGITYQHVFANTDFLSPGGATAFEITASVNANTALGFEATTASGGQFVVFRAITNNNDKIQAAVPTTSGRNASVQLGLASNEIETLRLYKNDIPLSKDGNTASLFTQSQQLWSSSIQSGDTLILSVDSTAFITFTVTDADFIATGLYTSVGATNSLASWVEVLNAKLTGVTVSAIGQQLEVTSNLGVSSRARLEISAASTLVTKGMFTTLIGLISNGLASDFTLSRPTAQFQLNTPLVAGDKLSAGSANTEAKITSGQIAGGSITFTADAHVWLLIDNPGQVIPTGVSGNTLISVAKPSTNVVRFGSTVNNAFASVLVGDYVIIWSTELAAADRLEGRVAAVTGTTLDILVTPNEWAAIVTTNGTLYSQGFNVLRSTLAPQKFRIQAGTKSLDQIALELQAQTTNLAFSVLQEQFLSIASVTKNSAGSILVATSDAQGILLNLSTGLTNKSQTSLIAYYDSGESLADMPLFLHAMFASGNAANPIDTYISSFTSSVSLAGRDPNELIALLHPYGTVRDAQPYGEAVQETSIVGTTIGIANESNIRRLRPVDRYFLASPLDFGSQDSVVAILDNDTENKSFAIPFYRRGITNTGFASNPTNFNAYDVDSGSNANFSSAFGATFDFSNFKVLMQAKKVLKPTPAQTALLYRSNKWGRSGEKINVAYVYPSVPNAPIASTIVVTSAVSIQINLKSGASVPSSIDSTTEWNVSITPNTPSAGIDQVTYAYSGVGTAPALGLSGGEYVNIGPQTELSSANAGIFRVSTQTGFLPNANSFTVQRPTGSAVAENNRATLANGAIVFYAASSTLASDINTYVNANLSSYVSSTIVNDGGSTGSGVIVLSTFEDSGFTIASAQLKDGINWVASSNLTGNPQFSFKVPLSLPTDVGYAFNGGDEVRLIPTTIDQVERLISVLAVTGFSTVGSIGTSNRGSRLDLSTNILGSSGAVEIVGGEANQYGVPILDTAVRLDNQNMSVSVDQVSSQAVHSDQWFRLQASLQQRKAALLSSNTSITLVGNDPTTGQATVSLLSRNLSQRYFGKPRNHTRPVGNTFRVEKQGSLVCISWNGVGSSPALLKSSLNFNDTGGGTLNVSTIAGSNSAQYTILTGAANFTELSIGDLITISGLPTTVNNGTFLVTGVSDNGKNIQVLNQNAANEYSKGSFTFTGNSTAGDQFTVGSSVLVAGAQFAIGGNSAQTAGNLSAVIGTLAGVSAVAIGSVVHITATAPSSNTALAYSGTAVVTVSGSALVGDSFVAGNFSASSGVSEGDTIVISAPFSVLNQGSYRVIRRYNDSIWIENPNVIEEEVTLTPNTISLGVDGTTSLNVNATNHTQFLVWNGIGTEPHLENANMGDLITFGTDFSVANRGTFMVLDSGQKLQQISNLTIPAGGQFVLGGVGTYFKINSAGNLNQYYVWFNVNGGHSDPAPGGGLTGIEVDILSGDTAPQAAVKAAAVIGAATGLGATVSGAIVTVTTTGFQATNDPVNVNVPAPFVVQVIQEGQRTFVECINPSAVNQSNVLISNVLTCNRPQMEFFEYDATVPGDQFVITGNTLGAGNAGTFNVVRVINRDTAVVSGALISSTNSSLNGQESAVYLQEGVPYSGYKHVLLSATQPGAPTRNLLIFDSNNQYEKIDNAADVQMTSLNKLNFSTVIQVGLDSYRYNTGLIAEANRIIYGDARDPITYPGVGAAGAVIFTRGPLSRRIQVSLDIRLNTGVPFATTAQTVRTTVSSLIKSNPIGQPIAISAIVAAVNAISGVRAVAVSSPLYDANDDLIFIAPSEKAFIVDPTLDIAVNQIGS